MTATSAFRNQVIEAVHGSQRAGALSFLRDYANGVDGDAVGLAESATAIYFDSVEIVASGTLNLDLSGGVLGPDGVALVLTKVLAIYLKASAANTNDVTVGGAASNGFQGPFGNQNDIVSVRPGGVLLITDPAGWTVTAATGDILKIVNSSSGTVVDFDIVIIGETA